MSGMFMPPPRRLDGLMPVISTVPLKGGMSLNNHNLTNKCNEFSEVVKVQCQEPNSLKVTLITKMLLI
jgi:hypothetical protein